ncbi:hypothetical protein PPYR_07505 [Photinus pyralis]|uniref:Uncharacterized protein n=1 Tax=Photinus pyralis TaxID=7054 RepID=A0A1Y1MUG5_PHOPY|nr:glutathione S-transferase 1-like [Photinus pyralis]KAB0799625.1 hypothetical protein PPYR_07505 [Photinus pyralis]
MAPIKLYKCDGSPPVRAVLLTAKALGVHLVECDINFFKGEHKTPEYLAMNPLHTVPTMDDNGKILCDSHAMMSYLVGKFAKDDSLYPKDLFQRALVDQKFAFDLGVLFPLLKRINFAYISKEVTSLTPKMREDVGEAYDFLEKMLKGKEWIALDHVTLADFCCYTSLTCLVYHVPIDPVAYPCLKRWFDRCRHLPLFASDAHQFEKLKDLMKAIGACKGA